MNKSRLVVMTIALLLCSTACRSKPEPTSVLSPTVTIAPDETRPGVAVPTVKPTVTSTLTPTLIPVPVWKILFAGAPCTELNKDCTASMVAPTYYYSIDSNGNQLQPIPTVPELAGLKTPSLPADAPTPTGWPQPSPDGTSLVYYAYYTPDTPSGLYLVDVASGETNLLLSSKSIPGSTGLFYPVCWSPDGTAVKFYVRFQDGGQRRDTFYSIDKNGQNLKESFALTGLDTFTGSWAINTGTCSPDSRELAFAVYPDQNGGLYILNLDSGQWRQVLTNYGVYRLITEDFVSNSPQ